MITTLIVVALASMLVLLKPLITREFQALDRWTRGSPRTSSRSAGIIILLSVVFVGLGGACAWHFLRAVGGIESIVLGLFGAGFFVMGAVGLVRGIRRFVATPFAVPREQKFFQELGRAPKPQWVCTGCRSLLGRARCECPNCLGDSQLFEVSDERDVEIVRLSLGS